jgi:hypothetical protein
MPRRIVLARRWQLLELELERLSEEAHAHRAEPGGGGNSAGGADKGDGAAHAVLRTLIFRVGPTPLVSPYRTSFLRACGMLSTR